MADYIRRTGGGPVEFSDLNGKSIVSIDGLEVGSDEVIIKTSCGAEYRMLHIQDCCESVEVNDVCGDFGDLIGSVVIDARCDSNGSVHEGEYGDESHTWTFYNIQTSKGHVQIKWYGASNGFYSEEVDFYRMKSKE